MSGGPRSPAHTLGGSSRARLALLGAALAAGAPLGLLLTIKVIAPATPEALETLCLVYSAVGTTCVFTMFGLYAGKLMDALRSTALHDGLTGLLNRRFLLESMPKLQAAAQRRGQPLTLLMLDLDHFKRVNDRHGHPIGDQTLRAVAKTLGDQVRSGDLAARFGGEEFAVLCPDTDREAGFELAERLRRAIAALPSDVLGHPGPVTVSIGVGVHPAGAGVDTRGLLARADAALYRAKAEGRDRSVIEAPTPESPS